jgi:hypothetical protein
MEYAHKRYQVNRKEILDYERKRYQENPARKLAQASKWQKDNRGKATARVQLRNAQKLQATPKWLTNEQLAEMKQFYINCPEGYHVDHIHPLRGNGLCGLHVPWNLQYLPAVENHRKSNHF